MLKTERLILRRWEDSDAENLYEYARDPDVGPIAGWPAHQSVAESLQVIRTVLDKPETYAVCLKTDARAIGSIGLKLNGDTDLTDRDDECELGYWIGKPFWGQGLIPEAAREMLRHAFEDLGMSKVYCGYYDGNEKSKRVQEKIGLHYQWTTEEVDVPLMHETRKGHVNAVTKEQWTADRSKGPEGPVPERTKRMPASVAAVLGGRTGKMDGLGKSGAQVLLFDDYVLKIRPADDWDTMDVRILQWLSGKVPVPRVAAHEVQDGMDWLLMTRIRGTELCKPEIMNNAALLLDCMAEALHALWSVPVEECPFERTVGDNLAHAEAAIRAGRFDPSDCEPETFGPDGFENPTALLDWLKRNVPRQDRVVTHGDFCLPNLFTDGKQFTGFIDVGNVGAGDRWMDLALGWRSLKHNSDGHYGKIYPNINPDDLFRAAGVPKDEEKLRYYILLDELN